MVLTLQDLAGDHLLNNCAKLRMVATPFNDGGLLLAHGHHVVFGSQGLLEVNCGILEGIRGHL